MWRSRRADMARSAALVWRRSVRAFGVRDRARIGRREESSGCPSPATRRDRYPSRSRADSDVGRVLGPGPHINRRYRAAAGELCAEAGVGNKGGLAVRRHRHPGRTRSDGDVAGLLGPGLHVNRRHQVAEAVGDEGGPAVRRDRHPSDSHRRQFRWGFFFLVFTSIVDTVPLRLSAKRTSGSSRRAGHRDTSPTGTAATCSAGTNSRWSHRPRS
jgi:hypothetical protein